MSLMQRRSQQVRDAASALQTLAGDMVHSRGRYEASFGNRCHLCSPCMSMWLYLVLWIPKLQRRLLAYELSVVKVFCQQSGDCADMSRKSEMHAAQDLWPSRCQEVFASSLLRTSVLRSFLRLPEIWTRSS